MSDASRAFPRSSASLFVGACALATTTLAFGADPSTPAVKDGLLQFDHVRVVNAPVSATTSGADSFGHLRAFVDETGALRQPTPEEMQAMSQSSAAPQARSARSSAPVMQPMLRTTGTRIMLDESQMQFAVVKRSADGTLVEACVTGEGEAAKLVHQQVDAASSALGQGETR